MAKVLIIEDDVDIRSNLSELIEIFEHEVETASNGVEGLKKAHGIMPDLIICDIRMPEKNGYDVKKYINSNEELKDIPFVFLTAMTSLDELNSQKELGKFDYIIKPYQVKDIESLMLNFND